VERIIMEFFEWIIVNGQKDVAERYNTFVFYASDLMADGYKMPGLTNKGNLISRYFEISKKIDLKSFENIYFTLDEIRVVGNKYSAVHIMR
jgi:hypothetical protein